MRRSLRPYVTTGIAIVGASLVAATPMALPGSDAQQRQVKLVDYTEYDASQLISATETNWSALESIMTTSNWTTDPRHSQGLSTLLTDLSTGTANPVTDPFSLLIEGSLGLLSSTDAANAASTALTAVTDNIESALSSGDTSLALTDLENAGTTVLYAFLNGYPDAVGSGNDLSPEFGLLTNTINGLATGQLDGLSQLSNTIADEISAIGGGGLTSTPTVLEPGSIDLSINVASILNLLAPGGDLTLPVSIDSLLGELAPSGTLTLPVSIDSLLTDFGSGNDLDLGVSLDSLLEGATNGQVTLPLSLDGLLSEVASNGNITVPITIDQVLGDVLGGGGSITVPPIALSTILPADFSVTLPKECIASLCVGGNTISIPDPAYNETITPPAIPDSTILSTLESALGSSGNSDLTVSLTSLESLLGTTGSEDISVSTATLESLLGNSGSSDITLSISDLESLLGSTGSNDISLPLSTLESVLGGAGSSDISIPISALEGVLPSTLTLDLDIPGITGGAVPQYDVDLAQDLLAALGNITPLAQDIPSLLTPDPTFDVTSLLSSALSDLGLPVTLTGGDLTLNLTGVLAEVLASL